MSAVLVMGRYIARIEKILMNADSALNLTLLAQQMPERHMSVKRFLVDIQRGNKRIHLCIRLSV